MTYTDEQSCGIRLGDSLTKDVFSDPNRTYSEILFNATKKTLQIKDVVNGSITKSVSGNVIEKSTTHVNSDSYVPTSKLVFMLDRYKIVQKYFSATGYDLDTCRTSGMYRFLLNPVHGPSGVDVSHSVMLVIRPEEGSSISDVGAQLLFSYIDDFIYVRVGTRIDTSSPNWHTWHKVQYVS